MTRQDPTDREAATAPPSAAGHGALQLLTKLLPYYLDCVREDVGHGAHLFLTDEGKTFLVPPIEREWSTGDAGVITISLDGQASAFAKSLQQLRGTSALFYGYPLYVDWLASSRSGWTGGFAVPVFLLPVEFERAGLSLRVRLLLEWPRINSEFLQRALASPEERRDFVHSMGLHEMEGEPPPGGLAELGRRLADLGVVPQMEAVDPERLSAQPAVSSLRDGGLYNRALIVLGERSKFTAGLERELTRLQKENESGAAGATALQWFFGSEVSQALAPSPPEPDALVEVVNLNDEQRAAVRSAFERPLTVVTGPPGTGKSQVVVSILANAYLKGERVLFTSRNHKAVDVVEDRVNGLSTHPLVVRSGSRSTARDLRTELIRFLTQVLSASASDEDRRAYADVLRTLETLRQRRAALWERVERVRQARNRVDQLDRGLDGPRERLGPGLFARLAALTTSLPAGDPDHALEIARSYLTPPAGLLGTIGRALRRGGDSARLEAQVRPFRSWPDLLGSLPATSPKDDWSVWAEPLKDLADRVAVVRKTQEYREALAELLALPSPEVFADELADVEERIWDWGARLIATYGRLLPDRMTAQVRTAVSEFRSTIERLSQDQVGGRAYAQLRQEQERLFRSISQALPVWCVTNLSAAGALPFEPCLFDLVVIDEASQCDIPSAVPLLFRAKRAIIIGDPHQLRHITSMEKRVAQSLDVRHGLTAAADQPYAYATRSLFDLALHRIGGGTVVQLREHFRSHAAIIAYSNREWYQNTLRVCTDYRRLRAPSGAAQGVRWTEVEGRIHRPAGGGAVCPDEARAVVDELYDLLVNRHFTGTVGVVSPFRAQVNRIRDLVNERLDLRAVEACDLIVDTAHGFQGDERDVILFSPCVGPDLPRGARYFLETTGNLFNVAITRARALLHVVGNLRACAACDVSYIAGFAAQVSGRGPAADQVAAHLPPPFDDPRVGYWERAFYEALVAAGIRAIPQYQVHQYRLDFAVVDGDTRLDIEIDGEQFHRDVDGSRCREDVTRDWRLTMLGWQVKRFWVYRVRDAMGECVEEVKRLLAGEC